VISLEIELFALVVPALSLDSKAKTELEQSSARITEREMAKRIIQFLQNLTD
jgi:hypothetical protein